MNFVCRTCGSLSERPGRCREHGFILVEPPAAGQEASADPLLGEVVAGKYALVGVLGRGGFGTVYRAWQETLDRFVAVKIIRRSKARGGEVRERFLLEARAVARLHGPNIVTLHDFGETPDGRLYMVLELVDGRTLRHANPNSARVNADRVVSLALPILRALSEAHGHGLVHRDVKPSNLMLTLDDQGHETVKVLDFGVAKFLDPRDAAERVNTQSGFVIGTPKYISPEQAAGLDVGPPSDVFSVGVILYELLAGAPPYTGADWQATSEARIFAAAPALPEDVVASIELRAVIARSLERVVGDRYSAASPFAEALRTTPEFTRIAALGVGTGGFIPLSSAPPPLIDARDQSSEGRRLLSVDSGSDELAPPSRRRTLVWAAIGVAVLGVAVLALRRSPPDQAPLSSAPASLSALAPATASPPSAQPPPPTLPPPTPTVPPVPKKTPASKAPRAGIPYL